MAIGKRHTIRRITDEAVHQIDENFGQLYTHKLESRFNRDASSTTSLANRQNPNTVTAHIAQSVEHGQMWVSANGSQTIIVAFKSKENWGRILHATANVINTHALAVVSSMASSTSGWDFNVTIRPGTSHSMLSGATTASMFMSYSILGSP